MYLEHFGLREAPFRITPHTEFFFPGAARKATLEALVYATTHDEGIIKVSGEVGTGKTMLCRMLLETLPETVMTIYFANPSLSREEILDTIADELGVTLPEKRPRQLLRAIQDRLIDFYAEGRLVIIMIDEAHAMPLETLEEIRLLSNLESKRHKLLHIVLFGQPELDERLLEPGMRPLKERITHNFALNPLLRDDIGEYLMFRLRRAGYHGPDIFTPRAIRLISGASEGLTRRINILADKALLSAFSENRHLIDTRQVKAAIGDAQFHPMSRPAPFEKWITGAFAALLLAIIASLGYFSISSSPTKTAQNGPAGISAALPSPLPPQASRPLSSPDSANPASPPNSQNSPNRTEAGVSYVPSIPSVPSAQISPAPQTPPDERMARPLPPTIEERVAAASKWLESVPDSHFFIQLFSASAGNRRAVENFINQINPLDQPHLRVYRSSLSGQERYGVIYGDYSSFEAAIADLNRLNAAYSHHRPYIRSVTKLR